MKRKLLLVALVLLTSVLFVHAQTYKVNLSATLTKDYEMFKKGEEIRIEALEHEVIEESAGLIHEFSILVNGKKCPIKNNMEDRMTFHYQTVQDLWDAQVITNVIKTLSKKGLQSKMRSEMETDALEYISKVKGYNMELKDPFLENYIYSLVAKIAPVDIIDGRPGNVNILLVDDPSTNAGMYPNGTLVIHSGLLACLNTEDELVAILGHEIAHFILDHSVQNINKVIARKKRAEFWAAVATGVTAVAEGVAATQNRYYIPGAATLGVAALSTAIASEVIDHLGMKYNHEQEYEADNMAVEVLKILGYDPNALATALHKLQAVQIKDRVQSMYFQSYSHPALVERIQKAGTPQDRHDAQFEKMISFAVTSAARMKFEDRRFRQVLPLVSQNISNHVGTAEDYILKANCMMSLYDSAESNSEILQLIEVAKQLEPTNINIYKTEILAFLRTKDYQKAVALMDEYLVKLNELRSSLAQVEDDRTWDSTNQFTLEEIAWTEKMKIKVKNL